MAAKIYIRYCSMCGTSRRVVDLINREVKPLETNPEFEIQLEDIKGTLPYIEVNGRPVECDYKNYKAILYAFKQELHSK